MKDVIGAIEITGKAIGSVSDFELMMSRGQDVTNWSGKLKLRFDTFYEQQALVVPNAEFTFEFYLEDGPVIATGTVAIASGTAVISAVYRKTDLEHEVLFKGINVLNIKSV